MNRLIFFDQQFDHIRHCYGPVKLANFRAIVNGFDVWAMEILRAKYHDKDCDFRTCVSSDSHYHYIVKFNPLYSKWCIKNKKCRPLQ